MARRKKPENETVTEAQQRRLIDAVADHAPRSEKVAWERKLTNLNVELERLKPIEEQLTDLTVQKNEIVDRILEIRREMVKTCVHPRDHLAIQSDGTTVKCKFCEKVLSPVTTLNE